MDFSQANILAIIISIFIAMAFHEAMHAFTSHWLGDTTAQDLGRLTLNPLKHVDLVTTILLPVILIMAGLPPIFAAKPVPFNPDRVKYDEFGVAIVGVAGPLTNLVLAIFASGIVRLIDMPIWLGRGMIIFIAINISFFVFNMIPFPPLDGSRLLYAFAPEPVQKVMQQIEALGFFAIIFIFIIVINFASGPLNHIINSLFGLLLGV